MADAQAKTISGQGGALAVAALRHHGVDTLFTLSGGHIFPLYDGCVKQDVRLVDVRHEQTATFAAEAYAKVSRRPGVAALTAGPGVTNGVSAMASAHFTGSPILVLGGRAPQARWGMGSLQELDHVPIVEPVTKSASTVAATEAIPTAVDEAMRTAVSAHRGPVFLDFPLDVFFNSAEVASSFGAPVAEVETPPADPDELAAVADLLRAAERPVLLAGADVYWEGAEDELRALAEAAGLPVFMNGLGRGTLPADHRCAFAKARSGAFQQADLVIVAGTPLDFRLGFGQFGSARVVHLMDRPEGIAGHVDLAASAAGSLRGALGALAEACGAADGRSAWLETLRDLEERGVERERAWLESDSDPIHPGRIYGELARRLDRDAIVIGDGGDFVSYAGKLIQSYQPGCFLDPGPYGCLGTGPGYALGAKMAVQERQPARQVVLLLGDGAAGFALGDLDTLVRFGLDLVVVVGNNGCWGLEKHPMQQLYGYHVAAELTREARYAEVMEALGGGGERVSEPGALGAALDRAFDASGPYLVDVLTDPEDAYPRSSNLA